ncbi:kinase [Aeromonas encheleia]|nr:hypothetical protein [Aeromonas encheleia]VEG98493.1 kinase [Aeromonas encheleia]
MGDTPILQRSASRLFDYASLIEPTALHRERVESRTADIAGFALPDWQAVLDRDYEPWDRERLILDRATLSVTQSVEKIVAALAKDP